MPKITITVKKAGRSIQVDPYAPVISKQGKDKIVWIGDPPDLKFLVCFGHRTPFKHRHFGTIRPESGAILHGPIGREEFFKYSIEIDNKVLDPGIIIQR